MAVEPPRWILWWKWSRYSTHYPLVDGLGNSSYHDLLVKGIKMKNMSNPVSGSLLVDWTP